MDTVGTLLNFGKLELSQAGLLSAALDAEVLLAHCLNLERLQLFLSKNKNVDTHLINLYQTCIERRKQSEPVAYIIGMKEFWGLNFKVNPSVLIPRPDSETLIEFMLKLINDFKAEGKILDLGTGSGCLITAALYELPNFKGLAVDNSNDALEVAQYNLNNLGLDKRCVVIKSNWFENIPKFEFDFIISNPPYIESKCSLEKNVSAFEPHSALFAGEDGLSDYRKIASEVKNFMHESSTVLLEIGQGQGVEIKKIFQYNGLNFIGSANDICGIERILAFRKISCA